ncbi:glycoside hydrolase family 9 protein [Fulvivirga maritima]|uniref:glycoside hydrolase family 9 protein n=1 Tax=Fulvivirga maritima TaxID=2904247 RepID=UPI001F28E544|nr:glycoside hydrolase family 9 protein [Fulvivirga maritima]UII27898.1 glycoside hydrolase family 9 protein [Fulvivirga maritima]
MRNLITFVLIYLMSIPMAWAQYNYAEALQKSMLFYEAQQSGELTNNRLNWRDDSALDDGSDVGHDLTGGWYDAGDHVKFGFPMAFSATLLAWGGIEYEDGYVASGQMDYLKNNLRWVNDYFIKCHTAPNEFWGQVGNGGTDHAWWGSAEVMQMERPSYKIDASSPGSDLAGETAAALAAASIIFQDDDPAYSSTLLSHAIELYDFADNYRGVYSNSITDAAGYYRSFSGYNDELVWGAIWLYKATGDQAYLTKAINYYDNLSNEGQSSVKSYKWGLAWDDKSYGCYVLMAQLTGDAQYKQDAERHLDYWTDGYNGERINYTPGGLAYLDVWGALRYSLNTSFLALVYSPIATSSAKTSTYYDFAVSQMEYALGDNPRSSSYVCGFGNNFPENPHHRTAHGCWSNNQNGPPEFTRHTLYGALVGGPNSDDSYEDERSNYVNNEVACDYNAGFSGVLAKFIDDFGGTALSNFPTPETPSNEFFTEAKLNAEGTTHTEYAVWIYNHTAWPSRIADSYTFRLFIDISEGVSAGYSAADYVVSTNNGGVASYTPLMAWDASSNIYYTEVSLNSDIFLWPGGQGESRQEVQMRVRLPYEAPSSAWDPSNDWSYQGVNGTLSQSPNIPLYVDGQLAFGNEPGPVEPVDVTGVTVSPTSAELRLNQSTTLTATVLPANATNKTVSWSTSDNSIATVSSTGVVTGISEGTATITVTTDEGSYAATSEITVVDEEIEQFTVSTSVVGTGSVSLSPAGGTYDAGTMVTLTASPGSNYQFTGWSGDASGSSNPLTVTVNSDLAITATFEEVTVPPLGCETYQPISLPYDYDGSGDFCWVTSGNISFINSWNLEELTINGVDYTNTWSNSMPARIDGNYYIHYSGNFGWSHAEFNGSSVAMISNNQMLIYPNPASEELRFKGISEYKVISIINTSGKTIYEERLDGSEELTIPLNGIKPGVYILKAQSEQKEIVKQFIIE